MDIPDPCDWRYGFSIAGLPGGFRPAASHKHFSWACLLIVVKVILVWCHTFTSLLIVTRLEFFCLFFKNFCTKFVRIFIDKFVQRNTFETYHCLFVDESGASSNSVSIFPVHPDVKLKALPFYDLVAELVKPSSLGKLCNFSGNLQLKEVNLFCITH